MKKGFTLVELLFVMAIISILAGIGISKFSDANDKALESSMTLEIKKEVTNQVDYYLKNGYQFKEK